MSFHLDNFTNDQISELYKNELDSINAKNKRNTEKNLDMLKRYNNIKNAEDEWSRFRKALQIFISVYESIKGQ
jgi:hypothetical protein